MSGTGRVIQDFKAAFSPDLLLSRSWRQRLRALKFISMQAKGVGIFCKLGVGHQSRNNLVALPHWSMVKHGNRDAALLVTALQDT